MTIKFLSSLSWLIYRKWSPGEVHFERYQFIACHCFKTTYKTLIIFYLTFLRH